MSGISVTWLSYPDNEPDLYVDCVVSWEDTEDWEIDHLVSDSETGVHYWANSDSHPPTHYIQLPKAPRGSHVDTRS